MDPVPAAGEVDRHGGRQPRGAAAAPAVPVEWLTAWSTTAFTDRPNSAKYGRGIPGVKLQKRSEPAADGIHRYQLQYGGPLGDWTLAEALAEWKRRHGKDKR
ncbi:hypothetical protein ACQPYV_23055 [Micromonospora saelicesensis]|uniref:GNAT-like putative antirestriction protein n=1 Tax=Micromonospora saelicesensis TaxID=285676 RepID=UPI003D92E9E4